MQAKIKDILDVVNDPTLTTKQKHHSLSNIAERLISLKDSMGFTDEEILYMEEKYYYDDLNEGNTPYKPRYIVPNYSTLFLRGSKYLEIKPPKNLDEALDALLIMYSNVSSVTSYPVYLGQIDELLEKFVTNPEGDYIKVDRFLNDIDKLFPDSFCHMNIGPRDTKIGRMVIRSAIEHPSPTPNLSMKYNKDITPSDFVAYALKASLVSAKPAFANDNVYGKENKNYAIVSCYNSLPIGGGGSTLPRLKFIAPAQDSNNVEEFFNKYLPKAFDIFISVLNKRHNYIMQSKFFETDYLIKEGFLSKDKFIGMFGIIGLGSAVNLLMKKEGKSGKMGTDQEANDLGLKIMKFIDEKLNNYNKKNKTNFQLHAQVGADLLPNDKNLSLATRVEVGTEPKIMDHLHHIGLYQSFCKAGCGEQFAFDPIWNNRTDKLATLIIEGLEMTGTRYIGVYGQESDYIRVTGYLVKRSEVEKLDNGEVAFRDTALMGSGTDKNSKVFTRRTRKLVDKVTLSREEL